MLLKDSTYQQKFSTLLKPWMPLIVETIKRDLKQTSVARKYLPSKPAAKLTVEELTEGYLKAIAEDEQGEAIGEWVSQCWLLKKPDLYAFFRDKLSEINSEFDQIEEIELKKSNAILEEAVPQFGAPDLYLFTVINAVVFPPEVVKQLATRAETEVQQGQQKKLAAQEEKSVEKMVANYELQIARLTDKYEKKLQGFERKYLDDTESLKKQISLLQKRLNASANTIS